MYSIFTYMETPSFVGKYTIDGPYGLMVCSTKNILGSETRLRWLADDPSVSPNVHLEDDQERSGIFLTKKHVGPNHAGRTFFGGDLWDEN